jgi:hypothetical protein
MPEIFDYFMSNVLLGVGFGQNVRDDARHQGHREGE